jgi:2-amino-4-hydroxy-6-hydroxymethyldihydropteridine diphosphokinase
MHEKSAHTTYIALGSNIGDREGFLLSALGEMQRREGLTLTAVSGIYETAPVGYLAQSAFFNMACRLSVSLSPFDLLDALREIENKLGRTRPIRWGPRTIDLDILLYDRERIDTVSLTIPHPRMFERAFVLVPLRDIYTDREIKGRPLEELIEECPDQKGITLYKSAKDTRLLTRPGC